MQKLLEQIYNQDIAKKYLPKIKQSINKYKKQLSKTKKYTYTEKDIIMITYADQLKEKKETTLNTLNKFLNKYFKNTINSTHILPFYPYSSDDGFSVIDYRQVEKKYGGWPAVKKLAKSHRLMFDAVINHISSKSGWFKNYLKDIPPYNNYFIEENPKYDHSKVIRPRSLPLLTKFNTKNGTKHLWTTFSADQLDLNYKNPELLLEILDILMFYISQGAKLIRLDAIAFLWKTRGTTCLHLKNTHLVVKLIRKVLETLTKDITIITETNVPHKENISYFGNGTDEAHIVYQFSLPPLIAHAILTNNSKYLVNWAKSLDMPKNNTFFNFTASHDGVGVRPLKGLVPNKEIENLAKIIKKHGGLISYKNNSDGTKSPYELNINYLSLLSDNKQPSTTDIDKFILSQAIMIAMPGVPGIYFHSLVGSTNYTQGVKKTGRNRTINREKLNYAKLEKEIKNNPTRKQVYQKYTDLLKNRTTNKCFSPSAKFKVLKSSNETFVFERSISNKKTICFFNLTNKEKTIKNVKLNPYQYLFLKK